MAFQETSRRTQRRGCLCEAVAILVTTLNLFSSFLLRSPFPFTLATPATGKLCLRALFSREASEDDACRITWKPFGYIPDFSYMKEGRLDNGSGIITFIR